MANILLINSTPFVTDLSEPVDDEEFSRELTTFAPLGVLYISSVLEKKGHAVRIKDAAISPCREPDLKKDCMWADAAGVSITTPGYQNALQIVKALHSIDSGLPVVVGGPHVTFQSAQMLGYPEVDIAVRGEGEYTMVELVECLFEGKGDLKDITGITYRTDNTIQMTPDRPFIEDLDALPFPARHLVDLTAYKYAGSLVTGRGCPYKCIFCAAGPLSGYRYRVRSPENVVDEIRTCYDTFGIDHFFFADDTFTAIPERALKVCSLIKKMDSVTWKCEARANTLTPELLQTMAESGCVTMQIGVESGSDEILKKIRKGTTTDMVRKAVKWAVDSHITVICSFIIGHPYDTVETVKKSIAFGQELRSLSREGLVRTEFSLATPLPGSVLYEQADELGVRLLTQNWEGYNSFEPVIETEHLTKSQLRSFIFDAHIGEQVSFMEGV
jgi:anaerobic magnesium-protoporphyrin IX monomethyl ester cyclase